MFRKKRVGIFDSGIGGLTVLKECQKVLPAAQYFYLGDNLHAPYGSKSKGEIEELVFSALQNFSDLQMDAVVLACNTATAVCAEEARKIFPFPIVGMEPAVRLAAKKCQSALVLCTPQTANSERMKRLLKENSALCKFTVLAPEGLAFEIERALTEGRMPRLDPHLGKFSTFDPAPDGVVLGCTHYVFLREEIGKFYGTRVFDGNFGTAKRLQFVLFGGRGEGTIGKPDHGVTPPIFLGETANLNKRVYESPAKPLKKGP